MSKRTSNGVIKPEEELSNAAVAGTQNIAVTANNQIESGTVQAAGRVKAGLNAVTKKLVCYEKKMDMLIKIQAENNKIQRIKFAIGRVNSSTGMDNTGTAFICYRENGGQCTGKKFLTWILTFFWKSQGFGISGVYMENPNHSSESKDSLNEKFRNHIASQIHDLTGVKPRIAQNNNGHYGIYYQ